MLKIIKKWFSPKKEKTSHLTGNLQEVKGDTGDLFKGYKYRSALDNFCCPECWPLDGHVFPLDEQERPTLPRHEGCRCGYLPELKTWRDIGLDIDELPPVKRPWTIRDTRTTYKSNPNKELKNSPRTILENGFIDGTAEDWVKTLPDDLQRRFFKTEFAYTLWKSGKIDAFDLINPQTWQLRTDEELQKLIR